MVGDDVASGTNGVGGIAVVAKATGVAIQVVQLVGGTGEDAITVASVKVVVGLTTCVTNVSEDERSNDWKLLAYFICKAPHVKILTLLASGAGGRNASVGGLLAVLEENATATAENVTNDLTTLGVTAHDKLGVGALLVVRRDLGDSVASALGNRVAVRSG